MIAYRRRLGALIASAFLVPYVGLAQPSKVWRVGVLVSRSRPEAFDSDAMGEFPRAMAQLGYHETTDLHYEWRFADGNYKRLPDFAAELAKLNPNVIVTEGTPATRAANLAASAIPIVMVVTGDPVRSGFVKTLALPGGNITGVSQISVDVTPKELELLQSIVPRLAHVAFLFNPDNPLDAGGAVFNGLQAAAARVGIRVSAYKARRVDEIEAAFAAIKQARVGAMIMTRDLVMLNHRKEIVALAAKNRLAAAYGYSEYVEAGGLICYGTSIRDQYHRAASYVDKILKGAKPRDLPVEQPTKFELVINLKTAKALGVTIPKELLLRADEVIK